MTRPIGINIKTVYPREGKMANFSFPPDMIEYLYNYVDKTTKTYLNTDFSIKITQF